MRIGFISAGSAESAAGFLVALRSGLAATGYSEPQSLTIDTAFAEYRFETIPGLVEEFERRKVDLIVTHAAATLHVVKATRSVPVVYEFSGDPVSLGIAASLARPLYNSTGISLMLAELNGKRLEILREIMPALERVAIVANPGHAGVELEWANSQEMARKLGLEIVEAPTGDTAELTSALSAIAARAPQALVLFADGFIVDNRRRIVEFGMRQRIPVVSGWAVLAESGALFTYGPSLVDSYRHTAYFVDRVAGGSKPADLPIERPTILELVINLKTAKSLGLTIPPTLLARADTVIE